MGKLLKIIAGLVFLLVLAVIAAPMIIDPNDYREEIQQAVKEKTGRDLLINGELSLSVFPWLGVGINQVSLSNADGFKDNYFAQIEQANVKIKLLPLISHQIDVSTIVLKGLTLNLAKNQQGVTNWADLAKPSAKKAVQATTTPNNTPSGAELAAIAIGGVEIMDANVNWFDASNNESYRLIDLELTTESLSLGKPMAVDLAFTVDSSQPKVTARLELSGDLLINEALNRFNFHDIKLAIDAAGEPIPNGAMQVGLASQLTVDLADLGQVKLEPLTITFDDSKLTGFVALENLSKPAVNFNLALDTIDVDRYLPKQAAVEGSTAKPKAVLASPVASALIPVETIRGLNIDGQFEIGALKVNGLKAEQVSLQLLAKNGVLSSEQQVKAFYNGSYSGKTVVDARQQTPRISVKEQASNIDIGPLLLDLTGKSSLSGEANIKANVNTRGNSIAAFKSALNGTASLSLKEGAISGIDVAALMQQAQAVLKGDVSAISTAGTGSTPFSDMSASAKIMNGLVQNDDLLISSPLINVVGAGSADLVSEKLDYRLTLQRTKALSEAERADTKDLKNLRVPVNVAGTFTEPSIQLDVKAILLATQQEKIEEKKQELKSKLQDKLNEKLKGRAGELLKGLF
ncbi:AsmA family protein [Cycloclasticus sp. 46_120_T64]|nr:AsmA family protein [Cycloclasticus sp. 46_120_T64]